MILEDGTKILPVHFVVVDAFGRHGVACVPNVDVDLRPVVWQRSNDVRAVSCVLCKKTEAFRKAREFLEAAIGGSIYDKG